MMEHREDAFEEQAPEIPHRRMIVLPWLIWAITVGLAIGMVLYVSGVQAAEVFRSTDDKGGPATLRLHSEPCANEKVLPHIVEAFRSKFRRATLFYWGREWASCWFDHEGTIISIDEQGAPFQPLPRRLFRDESI